MNTLTRLRRAEKRIVKAQRRVWLAQLAFWPTVALAGLGAAALVAARLRGRSQQYPQPPRTRGANVAIDGLPHL